jgi:hypothetical protein
MLPCVICHGADGGVPPRGLGLVHRGPAPRSCSILLPRHLVRQPTRAHRCGWHVPLRCNLRPPSPSPSPSPSVVGRMPWFSTAVVPTDGTSMRRRRETSATKARLGCAQSLRDKSDRKRFSASRFSLWVEPETSGGQTLTLLRISRPLFTLPDMQGDVANMKCDGSMLRAVCRSTCLAAVFPGPVHKWVFGPAYVGHGCAGLHLAWWTGALAAACRQRGWARNGCRPPRCTGLCNLHLSMAAAAARPQGQVQRG